RMDHILVRVTRGSLEASQTVRAVVFLREKGILDARASAGQSATPLTDLQGAAEAAMTSRARQQVSQPEDRMLLAAPLLVDGAPEGALVVEHPSYVQPTDDDLELLGLFAGQAAVAVKNTRELSRLRSGALAALGRVATQVAHDLNKAFLNLVVNAIDAMEPGGTLTVRSRRGEDGKVEILVEDTGCGMDEETRAHIFELFFTTKPSGTGLGMSIVRSAMERHGG